MLFYNILGSPMEEKQRFINYLINTTQNKCTFLIENFDLPKICNLMIKNCNSLIYFRYRLIETNKIDETLNEYKNLCKNITIFYPELNLKK